MCVAGFVPRTENHGGKDDEADALDDNVQPPVHEVLPELVRRQLHAADEKDERDGAIENAVFGANCAAVSRHIYGPWLAVRAEACRPKAADRRKKDVRGKKYASTQAMAKPRISHWPSKKRKMPFAIRSAGGGGGSRSTAAEAVVSVMTVRAETENGCVRPQRGGEAARGKRESESRMLGAHGSLYPEPSTRRGSHQLLFFTHCTCQTHKPKPADRDWVNVIFLRVLDCIKYIGGGPGTKRPFWLRPVTTKPVLK